MQLIQRGQAPAFEVIYERHASAAFSLAYRIVGTRNGAEDVSQEAFLNLWRSGARYDRARGSVRTWVLGIVHHRAIDFLRRATVHDKRRASDEGIEERFESGERTDVEVARRDEAQTVRDAMDVLPREQRQVIELAYFGGFTHTEIADMISTAGRDDQGPDAARPEEDARPALRRDGDARMTPDHDRWADSAAAYLLGALPEDEVEDFEAHLADLRGVPRGARRARAGRARAPELRRADRAADRAEGADHGRGRARGVAAGRRRARGRPASRSGARPPALPARA